MLAVALSPFVVAAQEPLPRFEQGDCLIPAPKDVRLDCGRLVVAELRERPNGRTIQLPVAIFRAAQPSGAPPLVMLHGGPGLNGLRNPLFRDAAAAWALALQRDVVVYDQRGAGLSEPRLCPDVVETSRGRPSEQVAAACVASLKAEGIDPAAYNTPVNAADAIDLRRTLGYRSWDVFGVSYGARLAQELMRQDPAATRAVVLASPLIVGPKFYGETRLNFQRALERVFARCHAEPSCTAAFPSLAQDFYGVYEELTAKPLRIDAGTIQALDGSQFFSGIRRQMAREDLITRIPLLVRELRRGDREKAARALVGPAELVNPTASLVIAYDACGTALRDALDAANAQASGPFRHSNTLNCGVWQTQFADASTYAPVESAIPTLILTAEFDDRTPTEYGLRIGARLKNSYLYEIPGAVHGTISGTCQDRILLQFLEAPARAPDASCIATQSVWTFETSNLDVQRFVFRIAASAQAINLAGTWELTLSGPQTVTTIDLRVDGVTLTGTLTPPRGVVTPIFDGRFDRGTVTFKATSPDGDRTVTLTGVADGDAIEFSRDLVVRPGGNPGGEGLLGVRGPRTFTARRVN